MPTTSKRTQTFIEYWKNITPIEMQNALIKINNEQRRKDDVYMASSNLFLLYANLFPNIKAWDLYLNDIRHFANRWYANSTLNRKDL